MCTSTQYISFEAALQWVAAAHAEKGQTYCGEVYTAHLLEVVAVAREHGTTDSIKLIARLLHDVFEDTTRTPADALAAGFHPRSVQLAELVTDEPGETREEKKKKTYPKIAADADAVELKLDDRIANVRRGKPSRSSKFLRYCEEQPEMERILRDRSNISLEPRWKTLRYELFNEPIAA